MFDLSKIKKIIDYIIVVGIVSGIYFSGVAVVAKVKEMGGFNGGVVFTAWFAVVCLVVYLGIKDLRRDG
jgi:hypothetical protein